MQIIDKVVYLDSMEEYIELEEDHFGMCLACGEEHNNCEPDASGYICDACGAERVEGIANLLMLGRVQ